MTGLIDEGRAVDIIRPDFRKAFDTVSRKTVKEKLVKYEMDEQMVRWTENWLNGQRVVISDMTSWWRSVTTVVP